MIYNIIHSTAEDAPDFEALLTVDDHIPQRGDKVQVNDKLYQVIDVVHKTRGRRPVIPPTGIDVDIDKPIPLHHHLVTSVLVR